MHSLSVFSLKRECLAEVEIWTNSFVPQMRSFSSHQPAQGKNKQQLEGQEAERKAKPAVMVRHDPWSGHSTKMDTACFVHSQTEVQGALRGLDTDAWDKVGKGSQLAEGSNQR